MKERLEEMEFFEGLERKLLRRLEESTIACQYSTGEVIVKEGELGLGMYVIVTGRVEVSQNRNGVPVRLAELGPKQVFAEMSLIDDQPRSASITTLEETECLLFTRDSFSRLMEKHPALSIRLARNLARRLRRMDEIHQTSPAAEPPRTLAATTEKASPSAVSNGQSESASDASWKAAVQKQLLTAFERLYTVKAFTRFSVAVLGCPVECASASSIEEIRLGDVKALIFPAGESAEMRIEAFAAGAFNLHVFTPEFVSPVRFGPVPIRPNDVFTLTLPSIALAFEGTAPAPDGFDINGL